MATRQTSMHTFSGQLGSTVGYLKYGENYERILGKAKTPHNPKTQKQQNVRLKFAMLNEFISRIAAFIQKPFKSSTMPSSSACFKANYEVGIGGTFPNFEILYNKFKVSKGNLDLPYSPSALIDSGAVHVSWTDNSGVGKALATDCAMILVYNSAKGQAVYNRNAANRQERQASLMLPTAWNGDSVDIWMAMRNVEDNFFSESAYLGNYSN